jgi:hypothetical protein
VLQRATRLDRSSTALAVTRSPRDGVVHLRVPLTWIGVRTYRDPVSGKLSRELRRPEQVWSASHIESLKRLTCTHGHPEESWQGSTLPVMLDARADAASGPEEDGTLRRPPTKLQVGHVGDTIERVEVDGADLPIAVAAIHGATALADIEAGKTQTSLGYGCLVDRTPGTWTDSSGREWEYDAEHVLDATDPRVLAAVANGFDASTLGANHLAVGIARGRGGTMSEILRDAWVEDEGENSPRSDLGEPRLFAMVRNGDESGVSGTGRVLDGVLWPDGHVAVRWRTETASETQFADWSTFHAIHVCAHPTNNSDLPFADGGPAPACSKCGASEGEEAAAVPGPGGAARSDGLEGAAYPRNVAAFNLPLPLKALADKLAARAGSKPQVKADSISIDLPPGIDPAALADMFTMLGDQIRGMSTELVEADKAIGEGAAALATAQEAATKMADEAKEVAPLLADARKAKRDALVAEALKVAPGMPAPAADASDLEVKRSAVKARIPSFARDSADAVSAAYEGLLASRSDTAGGKDPADKPAAPKPGSVPPADKPKDVPPEQRSDSAPVASTRLAVLYGDEG